MNQTNESMNWPRLLI